MFSLSRRAAVAAVATSLAALVSMPSFAAERGTPEEAQAMVKRAVAYYKSNGLEKSIAAFQSAEPGPFRDRDLYVFMIDPTGVTLANGGNPRLVGKQVIDLKDADGKEFVKEYVKIGQTTKVGKVSFKYLNPMTKAIEPKVAFVEWIGDVMIASGAYIP
jgi:hypothetical protein